MLTVNDRQCFRISRLIAKHSVVVFFRRNWTSKAAMLFPFCKLAEQTFEYDCTVYSQVTTAKRKVSRQICI